MYESAASVALAAAAAAAATATASEAPSTSETPLGHISGSDSASTNGCSSSADVAGAESFPSPMIGNPGLPGSTMRDPMPGNVTGAVKPVWKNLIGPRFLAPQGVPPVALMSNFVAASSAAVEHVLTELLGVRRISLAEAYRCAVEWVAGK